MILNHRRFSAAKISCIIVLIAIGIIYFGGASWNQVPVPDRAVSGQPLLIPQGPMGSWHTYTMNYTGSGVWSFYMDNQFLGSSPTQGQQYYLGAGDTDSGATLPRFSQR